MKKIVICIVMILALGAMVLGGYAVLSSNNPEVSVYRIITESKEEAICCVKVTGMKNKLIQDKLNQTIQIEWLLWLKDYLDSPLELSTYISGYFISDQYLCITGGFDGYGTRGGGRKYYCAVYDLKNGKKVYLDDLFELNDGFIHALKQYGKTWQFDLGEIILEIPGFEDDSEEEIKGFLERVMIPQSDYNKTIEGTDRKSYYRTCFTISEEYLYLNIRIPLDKLEEFLKVPKWWKSKPGLKNADIEMVSNEIKKYLNMTNREIADLTGKNINNYGDIVVFTHTSHTQAASETVYFKEFGARNSYAACVKPLAAANVLCK